MIATLATIALLSAIAHPSASRLAPGASRPAVAGVSLLLGSIQGVIVLLLLSFAGIAWSRLSFGVALAIVGLGGLAWARTDAARLGSPAAPSAEPVPKAARLLDSLTAAMVLAHARYATHADVVEWDYVAMWGQKAKVFWLARGVDFGFLAADSRWVANPDYPPLPPLLYDAMAIVRGRWDDRFVGLVATAFGAAALLLVRDALRRSGFDPVTRALATLALTGAALSPWVGLAEGPVLAYLGTGWLAVRDGRRTGSTRWLVLGGLLLGGAALTKNEGGVALVAALIAAALSSRPRSIPRITFQVGLPTLLVALPWVVAREALGLRPLLLAGHPLQRLGERLADPKPWLDALLRYPPDHLPYWLVAIGVVLLGLTRAWRRERFLLVALLLQGGVYLLQNLLVPVDVVSHIQYSFHRLVAQLALPLGALALLVAAPESTARGSENGNSDPD